MKHWLFTCVVAALPCMALAQSVRSGNSTSIPVGIRFVATSAHSTSSTAGFFLTGGAADVAVPATSHLEAAVEIAGTTAARVPDTARGLSTITLLAGPRFTRPTRHLSLSLQALFGAVHGSDADFSTAARHADTATAFAFAGGGFVDIPVTRTVALRAIQMDYLQTRLPNGTDNRQGDFRLGTGLVFHVSLPATR